MSSYITSTTDSYIGSTTCNNNKRFKRLKSVLPRGIDTEIFNSLPNLTVYNSKRHSNKSNKHNNHENTQIENNMIPNYDCNKHINKMQSNPSTLSISINKKLRHFSVASNNSFRKKATQVFTTNTHSSSPKMVETVNNFSQPTHRYATSSNILVNGEATTCLIVTGAFTSFISASYFKTRSLFVAH